MEQGGSSSDLGLRRGFLSTTRSPAAPSSQLPAGTPAGAVPSVCDMHTRDSAALHSGRGIAGSSRVAATERQGLSLS